ncbi:hypothetical protein [Photobacterium atrarenae]|uniref:Uncharacterized protein n=1 Tax=Photobacterium atrarenae TaxID=865757 RepID=A0ABY5GPE9_9GAMM|nr:hypothetical protein [Photobacterium atrarenae]UTV30975.1 hypothetical protein NNL38_24520 [Photobacterium atrarenae]
MISKTVWQDKKLAVQFHEESNSIAIRFDVGKLVCDKSELQLVRYHYHAQDSESVILVVLKSNSSGYSHAHFYTQPEDLTRLSLILGISVEEIDMG